MPYYKDNITFLNKFQVLYYVFFYPSILYWNFPNRKFGNFLAN